MDSLAAADITLKNGETTHYYEGGTKDGIPLIFIHGWPDIAEVWKHQLTHFSTGSAGSEYRVLALDMRGYGESSSPKNAHSYSLEVLTNELIDFAEALNIKKAVWIGHDWGCGVVSSLAAHNPDLFLGLAVLAVPYRTLELGFPYLVSLVNRSIYPQPEYPYGQFEYMKYYELHPEESVKAFESNIDLITKAKYIRHDPSKHGHPSPTSRQLKDGGWFGGHPEKIPDIPLSYTTLDESLYRNLLKSHKKHGFFPPTAYYLNHAANAEFARTENNDGVLEFPVLYIDAKHDAVCSPSTTPKMGDGQREKVRELSYETVEAGHWVQLEKPGEVNRVLEGWLDGSVQFRC